MKVTVKFWGVGRNDIPEVGTLTHEDVREVVYQTFDPSVKHQTWQETAEAAGWAVLVKTKSLSTPDFYYDARTVIEVRVEEDPDTKAPGVDA